MVIKVKPMKKRFLVLAVILSASTITVVECRKELEPGERCHTSFEGFELHQLDGDWTKDLSKGVDGPPWTEDHVEISYSECQFASWTRSGANSVAGYWYPRGNNVVLETFYAEEFDLWKDVRMKGKDSIIFLDSDGHKVFLRRMEEAEELPVAQ